MDVAELSEVDKGRRVPVGLGELDGTVVGGGDVVTVAKVGEAVVGVGVTEQVRLAVPVDGCAEGERLADGGLTVGEGWPLHAVTGRGTNSCKLWPACTAASTHAVDQVEAVGCVDLGGGGETH